MYIATGSPSVLSARTISELEGGFDQTNTAENLEDNMSTSSSIVTMKKSSKSVFATITPTTISLWSIKPELLLSYVQRNSSTLKEDGENVDIIWKPDASQLVVVVFNRCNSRQILDSFIFMI